jgi:hypothetical protein
MPFLPSNIYGKKTWKPFEYDCNVQYGEIIYMDALPGPAAKASRNT